jgi:acyl carrier protein
MFEEVRSIMIDSLQLGPRGAALRPDSQLLGALPELDSMAVVTLLTAIEERFGITIADDEISADAFETMGTLVAFVERKVIS